MIIDAISCFVPTEAAFIGGQVTLSRLQGYLEHFVPKLVEGKSAAEIEALCIAEAKRMCPGEDGFIAEMDRFGIDKAAIYNELYTTSLGVQTTTNDEVARVVARFPTRLLALGGVDPWDEASVADMERSVRELGMQGFVLSPFKQRLAMTDARLMRVYAKCEQLGVPILLHTGINWWKQMPYDMSHPRHVDAVAVAFPELTIIMLHAGWPWVQDAAMVAWRHRNVYLDISAHRPKHFTVRDTGWEPLMQYGNRMLADKVIFGSTWCLMGTTMGTLVDEVKSLPLREGVAEKWLGGNAARAFRL